MTPESRAKRVAFRRAVWASLTLHAVCAAALLLLVWSRVEPKPIQPGIDTRAADEPRVSISFADSASTVVEIASQPTPQPDRARSAEPPPPPVPAPPTLAAGPVALPIPQTRPPELIGPVHRPVTSLLPPAGAETPIPPMTPNGPLIDSNVRPAGASGAGPQPTAGTLGAAPSAIHGALAAGKTVVYVLDCSGSMGAAGRFDAARGALVATLRAQPATVCFQVIVYASDAVPLVATNGKALPANELNVRTATQKLAPLEPRGRSNHLAAIRAALAFRPDVIVVLTDADDLSTTALKPLLAGAAGPVTVWIGQVTAEGVQRPREVR